VATIRIIGPAWPYRGGIASGNERLAEELISEGHSVELETFTVQYPRLLFPGKTQYVSTPAPGELVIRRTIHSMNPLNWLKTGKRIQREKPDIVIVRYWLPFLAPCLGTIARTIRKNKHSRIICLADNVVPHEKRPGDPLLTSYFMSSIDGLVAMSKKVLDDALSFRSDLPVVQTIHPLFDNFGERIGREQAMQLLQLDPAFNYLLFFGFIRDYKGLDILLEAFADQRLQKMPVKLIVAGEFYSKSDKYFQMIKELNLENRIILKTDFIPNDQVNRYFCAANMVVQPYKSATQSGVTQIGFHFHKPMLVTDVGGLSEIILHRQTGYVVQPCPAEIADALLDFFENQREAQFSKKTEEEKKKFAWSNMTKAIFNVYNQLI
jgi:glycosyltransferase involved in cell wall biosynthesis